MDMHLTVLTMDMHLTVLHGHAPHSVTWTRTSQCYMDTHLTVLHGHAPHRVTWTRTSVLHGHARAGAVVQR